jgi:DNA-binding transcriptional MerR regulator
MTAINKKDSLQSEHKEFADFALDLDTELDLAIEEIKKSVKANEERKEQKEKKVKVQNLNRPKVQVAQVIYMESPVPVGLVLRAEKAICPRCSEEKRKILGMMIKYSYKGAVLLKPVNEVNKLDAEKLQAMGEEVRELSEETVEGSICAKCSNHVIELWVRGINQKWSLV